MAKSDKVPYEEYLKNFRKTHHPREIAMSKEQYEQMLAKDGVKAQEASPEASNGMVINGVDYSPSYEASLAEHREKNGPGVPFMPKEQYETTKDRIYNQGTSTNVDDTRAIGATKEDLDYMLQNGLISKDAYDKQIAALNTPEVQEEMARGEKKADETVWDSTNREVANSVAEVTTPKEGDSPTVISSKNNYNKAMMSIWDAYRNKEISPETAGYFTIDAIATLAKNLGRSIGNVGAQFSGGTIDNGHDESKWGQRQNALLNEEIGMETESLGGKAGRQAESEKFDNILKGYQTNRTATVNDMINDFRDKSKDPSLSETEKKFYQILAVELAGAGLNGSTQIASIGSGVWDDIKSKFSEWFGKKDK